MTGDKTLRCYTVPLLLILCYLFQNSNLFVPLQGFRLSSPSATAFLGLLRDDPRQHATASEKRCGHAYYMIIPRSPSSCLSRRAPCARWIVLRRGRTREARASRMMRPQKKYRYPLTSTHINNANLHIPSIFNLIYPFNRKHIWNIYYFKPFFINAFLPCNS